MSILQEVRIVETAFDWLMPVNLSTVEFMQAYFRGMNPLPEHKCACLLGLVSNDVPKRWICCSSKLLALPVLLSVVVIHKTLQIHFIVLLPTPRSDCKNAYSLSDVTVIYQTISGLFCRNFKAKATKFLGKDS